jgi:TonB family protein
LKNLYKKILFLFSLLVPLGCWADCDQPETPYCSLQPSHTGATVINSSIVEATYPQISIRLGEWGTVYLRVLITTEGNVGAIEIKTSSGYPRLDQSAVDAVKKWKFNPSIMQGQAINEWYVMPYTFILPTDKKKMRNSLCLIEKPLVNENSPANWKKVFDNKEIYVSNIAKAPVDIKSLFDAIKSDAKRLANRIASSDNTEKNNTSFGLIFELIENNVQIKTGVLGSLSSYRIFDCANNEMYTLQESLYSCQWGTGDMLPIKEGIQLKKWMPIPTGSKDAELLQYICSKGY